MDFTDYSATRGRRPAAPRPGRCSPDQQLLAGPFVPSAAGFSVRRPVYGESRSGFVWLLPLLHPRLARLLHCFLRQSLSGFVKLLFFRRESAEGVWRFRFFPAVWLNSQLCLTRHF